MKGKGNDESLKFLSEYFENNDEFTKFTDDFRCIDNLHKILKANTAKVINSS